MIYLLQLEGIPACVGPGGGGRDFVGVGVGAGAMVGGLLTGFDEVIVDLPTQT
jgi:hypothetical protein